VTRGVHHDDRDAERAHLTGEVEQGVGGGVGARIVQAGEHPASRVLVCRASSRRWRATTHAYQMVIPPSSSASPATTEDPRGAGPRYGPPAEGGTRRSIPRYGTSAAGTVTEPSGCCRVSSSAAMVRGSATPDALSVWASSGFAPAAGR